jgi:HK97 family phage major capsid protein
VKPLEVLRKKREAAIARMKELHEAAGDNPLSKEQNEEFEAREAEVMSLDADIDRETRRANFAESLRSAASPVDAPVSQSTEIRRETGSVSERARPGEDVNVIIREDPFAMLDETRTRGLSPRQEERALISANLRAMEGREIGGSANEKHFERTLKRHAENRAWARNILARQTDVYADAFRMYMTGNAMLLSNEERAAMAVGTNTSGGYLVPAHLDPTLIVTNAGSDNIMRSVARVVTLTEGSAWNGVTTAGSTASWDGELVEVSDDTPAVGPVNVLVKKAQTLFQASIEATEDISGLAGDLLMLMNDSRDRLEGTAHMTGTGATGVGGQPFGIFTALDANTNVEIATATAGAIAAGDLGKLWYQLPGRWRKRAQWLMNPMFNMLIKNLGTAVSASYSGDLRETPADRIYGKNVIEADDAPSAFTSTTQIENVAIFGDFSNYLIVDKPGSTSIEYIPHLFNTANNLPDGRRGWYMYWRTGADSINDTSFRLLQDKTSA